jgi:hypothetical protein
MGVRIVIFLLFTSVTLIFNSMVIWFAYKAFANITTKVTETMREVHASDDVRSWLSALESASYQAVTVTGAAKERVSDFEPTLAKAQSKFGYGLAKVDVNMERFHETVRHHASKVQHTVTGPAHKIGATISGLQEVLLRFSGDQSGDDASSTPTK